MRATGGVVLTVAILCGSAALRAEPGGKAHERPAQSRASAGWQTGYAEADITPKVGAAVMMAGFGRERQATGVESPLLAQALVLQDAAGRRAVLIAADVLGFGRTTVDSLRRKIEAAHGIAPEYVCFAASHTHWGPSINHRTSSSIGDVNVWYLAFLESTLLELVDQALNNLSASEIAFAATRVQIGMCRRLPDARGEIRWAPNPDGSYDPETPIVWIRRQDSPRRIVLVGHACHPTSMGRIEKWSPDYPGAMRRKLESELDDCRPMFVMGCGGDAKVTYPDPKTARPVFAASPEMCYRAGFALADAVLERLNDERSLHPLGAELDATLVRGTLSLQPPPGREEIEKLALEGDFRAPGVWWARKSLAFPDPRREVDYAVQLWRLGSLTLIALEGEVCSEWGPICRSMATTEHAMTVGYANEVSCYIPTARIIREGGYEGDTSHRAYLLPAPFEPTMEEELTALVRQAVRRLDRRGKAVPAAHPE